MNTMVGRPTERLDGRAALSVRPSGCRELYIGATSIPVSERWDEDADEECNFPRRGRSREQLRIAADTRQTASAAAAIFVLRLSRVTCVGRHENPCVARTGHKLNYDERVPRVSVKVKTEVAVALRVHHGTRS